MKYVTRDDCPSLAIGATLLGSGGGGDPEYDCLRTQQLIDQHGAIRVVQVEELHDDALVVPVGFMGAPLVSIEKLPSGKEYTAIFQSIERVFGKKIDALVALEIGGSNAFAPLLAAGGTEIAVVDGDMIGRAFPQLEMSSGNLFNIDIHPAFIADSFGNVLELRCKTSVEAEKYFRALCSAMGSTAAVSMYIMTGKEAKRALIRSTLSRACKLGRREEAYCHNKIASGIVTDMEQKIDDGFLRGKIVVEGESGSITIDFQNEYLAVFKGQRMCAATPDIIAILDAETLLPLSVEQVKFGLQVVVISLDCDPLWKTEQGLLLVGPEAFGLEAFGYMRGGV